MPTSSPRALTSAPPELPALIAASVWMKSSNVRHVEPASGGADDAHRDRLAQAERVADREHRPRRPRGVSERPRRDLRQVRQVDLKQRELGLGSVPTSRGVGDAAVRELDEDLGRRRCITCQFVTT